MQHRTEQEIRISLAGPASEPCVCTNLFSNGANDTAVAVYEMRKFDLSLLHQKRDVLSEF